MSKECWAVLDDAYRDDATQRNKPTGLHLRLGMLLPCPGLSSDLPQPLSLSLELSLGSLSLSVSCCLC